MLPISYYAAVEKLVDLALEEDISAGDITTDHLIAPGAMATGIIKAKEDLVVAGLELAAYILNGWIPVSCSIPP